MKWNKYFHTGIVYYIYPVFVKLCINPKCKLFCYCKHTLCLLAVSFVLKYSAEVLNMNSDEILCGLPLTIALYVYIPNLSPEKYCKVSIR